MAERRGDLLYLLVGVLALLGDVLTLLAQSGRVQVDRPVVLGALVAAAGAVGLGHALLGLRR